MRETAWTTYLTIRARDRHVTEDEAKARETTACLAGVVAGVLLAVLFEAVLTLVIG